MPSEKKGKICGAAFIASQLLMMLFMFLFLATDNDFYMTLAVLMLLVYPLLICIMFLTFIGGVINSWWEHRTKSPSSQSERSSLHEYPEPETVESEKLESLMCPSCKKSYTSFNLFHKTSGVPLCPNCEVKLISLDSKKSE